MLTGDRAPNQRGDVSSLWLFITALLKTKSAGHGSFAAEKGPPRRLGPHLRRDSTSASAPRVVCFRSLSRSAVLIVCGESFRRSLTCPQAEIANTLHCLGSCGCTRSASRAAWQAAKASGGRSSSRWRVYGASEPTCAAAASDATCSARCASPFNARHAPCSVRRDAHAARTLSARQDAFLWVGLGLFVCFQGN
jgi:hypothetical protein